MILSRRQLASIVATPIPEGDLQRMWGRVETSIDLIGRRVAGSFVGPDISITLTDISPAGFGFISPEPIPCGGELLFNITAIAGEPITIRVMVRWCRAEGERFRMGTEAVLIIPLDVEFEPSSEFSDGTGLSV